jgi:hypothetical protein
MGGMKKILCVTGLMATIFFFSCTATSHYNFSLKDTLSIFLLNDGENDYFCIPVQYIGDYHVENFEFDNGFILIGDYKMVLEKDDVSIEMFVNEHSDESGNIGESYNLNQYNIFVEYILKKSDMDNIIKEYKKGNTYSKLYIEYSVTIDNEKMEGCGYSDDVELYNGPLGDSGWFPPNLEFFRQTKKI